MIEAKRLVLDELRKAFNGIYSASDTLDTKLQNILNYSSVIVSGLSIVLTIASRYAVVCWYWIFLSLSILLYCIMFVRVRFKIAPIEIKFPIGRDGVTLNEKYFDKRFDENRVLDQAIHDYLVYIDKASENNKRKAREIETSSWILFTIIISMLLSVFLGIVIPSLA